VATLRPLVFLKAAALVVAVIVTELTPLPHSHCFSHPQWMGAVLAHVQGAGAMPGVALPFVLHAVQRSGLPLRHLTSCAGPLTPCPLPSAESIPSVAQAGAHLDAIGAPLVLRSAPVDHPVMQALLDGARHVKILKTWARAGLDVSASFDGWMAENFDHKRRKELKRLKARLSEQGDLVLARLLPGDDITPHVQAFLALEASGWKGARGTAIQNDGQATAGLKAGLSAMHGLGKLRFWTLRLNGAPVASLFALVDGGTAVLGKIGYDEAFSKYSPGVLLIIEATADLFADAAVQVADANAIPGHPMIDRIWRDRIACMDVIIGGSTVSPLTFHGVALYLGTKDAARATIKRFYLKLTGRRHS
jgi:CelD/BcsL family acetyltransferase involved in cellulose biosynthesis